MQLKLQRSQRAGGIVASAVLFCLDVRADYAPDERDNIHKYRLGGQVIYSSRTARKHLDSAGVHLDRTQEGSTANRVVGLARGAFSLAMAKMSLNISMESLGRGHHIECKDLEELLEAEDTVREACKSVTRWLEAAATFNGSETVIEYVNGEERIHVTPVAPALLTYVAAESAATDAVLATPSNSNSASVIAPHGDPAYEFGQWVRKILGNSDFRLVMFTVGGLLLMISLVVSFF